jgi:hypothetical protein
LCKDTIFAEFVQTNAQTSCERAKKMHITAILTKIKLNLPQRWYNCMNYVLTLPRKDKQKFLQYVFQERLFDYVLLDSQHIYLNFGYEGGALL